MERAGTHYNTKAIAESEALYIGRQIPTSSIQYPNIVTEPLKGLYSKDGAERLHSAFQVKILVYSSGIVIQELNNRINWFPIQNLYCSAGLIPEKSKAGLVFKQLHESKDKKCKPLFAMVVRQTANTDSGEGRRVLMCHGFKLPNQSIAQRLVDATKFAYNNKDGWNHPMNDRQFLNAKIAFTLDKINDDEEAIEDLKLITLKRDQQLAQLPSTSSAQPRLQTAMNGTKSMSRNVSFQRQAQQYKMPDGAGSAPATPRMQHANRGYTPMYHSGNMARPIPSRISTARAITQYSGFHTDVMTNGTAEPVRSASIAGYPISRSGSQSSGQYVPWPGATNGRNENFKSRVSQKSKRDTSAPVTPKSHRVLASSEPYELVNGQVNGSINGNGSISVLDWDEVLQSVETNEEPKQQNGPKKSSRKKFEDYNMFADHNGNVKGRSKNEEGTSSSQSVKSDSGYSITKIDEDSNRSMTATNGFNSTHSYADEKL